MTPPPPPDGFTVPPSVAKRIPADVEFTVLPKWSRALSAGILIGLAWSTLLCGLWFVPFVIDGPTLPGVGAGLAIFVLGAVLFGTTVGLVLGFGGPLAACDDTGVWVRVRQTPAKAMFLPWQAVESVYTRGWAVQRVVCVRPRDPRAGEGMGVLADVERLQSTLFTGSGLIIPTLQADARAAEILHAFAHYANGRCHIAP